MKLLFENWRKYLDEIELKPKKTDKASFTLAPKDPGEIYTVGQLMDYFKSVEPGKLKKMAGKYGSVVAKAIAVGGAAAAATGAGAGVAIAGVAAEKVLEKMLTAAVMAFANIPDNSYSAGDGSAASFFDIDDTITHFLRNVETQEKNILNPSKPELEAFEEMREKVSQVAAGIPEDEWHNTKLSDLLRVTTQSILDANLLNHDKVKVQPA